MPRPTEYDRQEILDKAMAVFWRQGPAHTTLRCVLEETGFNRHSLYKEFGDMDGLFKAAVQNYFEKSADMWASLESEDAGLDTIQTIFDMRRATDCEQLGCLATNTIVSECTSTAGQAVELAKGYMKRVENGIENCIKRAQQRGEIPPDKDPHLLACFVTTVLHGMGATGKCGATDEEMKHIGHMTIGTLKR